MGELDWAWTLGTGAEGLIRGIGTDALDKKKEDPLKIELFDLENDPSESKDVAADHPEVVKKIEGLMKTERTVSEEFRMGALDSLE